MNEISDNIRLNSIDKMEVILHLVKVFKYVIFLTIAFFISNAFSDYKWISLIIIYLIIFYFFSMEMYKLRFGFRAMLERLLRIDYDIDVNSQGINLRSRYLQKLYYWSDIKKIVPEIITDLNEYNTNILTMDSRVFTILDDDKWAKLEIIKNWSKNKIEVGKIFEHSK